MRMLEKKKRVIDFLILIVCKIIYRTYTKMSFLTFVQHKYMTIRPIMYNKYCVIV